MCNVTTSQDVGIPKKSVNNIFRGGIGFIYMKLTSTPIARLLSHCILLFRSIILSTN